MHVDIEFTSIIRAAAWASQSNQILVLILILIFKLPIHLRSLIIIEKRRVKAQYQTSRLPSHKKFYNKLANLLEKYLAKYKSDI